MQQCIEHGFVAVNTYRSFRSTSSIDASDNIQLPLHSYMIISTSITCIAEDKIGLWLNL